MCQWQPRMFKSNTHDLGFFRVLEERQDSRAEYIFFRCLVRTKSRAPETLCIFRIAAFSGFGSAAFWWGVSPKCIGLNFRIREISAKAPNPILPILFEFTRDSFCRWMSSVEDFQWYEGRTVLISFKNSINASLLSSVESLFVAYSQIFLIGHKEQVSPQHLESRAAILEMAFNVIIPQLLLIWLVSCRQPGMWSLARHLAIRVCRAHQSLKFHPKW